MQVRNARLGMLAVGGFAVQAWVTGKGPIQNAVDHLRDPFGQNSEAAAYLHNLKAFLKALLEYKHGSDQLGFRVASCKWPETLLCCKGAPTCENECFLY